MVNEIRWIDLSLIDLPERGRQHDPQRIAELAGDMAKNGQLQDIVVAPKTDNRFEVVAGRGRYLAAQQLKWDKLQCLVKENLSEFDKACITISENDEREDVSPVDRGLSYIWAMEAGCLTQDALAEKIGKTQAYVSQYIAAASLTAPVLEIIKRFIIGIGSINQIVRLPTAEAQIAMAKKCQKEDLSVKQLENAVNKALNTSSGNAQAQSGETDSKKERKALQAGFHISKSTMGVHIIGDYPDTIPPPELAKALEFTYQQWLDNSNPDKSRLHISNTKEVADKPVAQGQPIPNGASPKSPIFSGMPDLGQLQGMQVKMLNDIRNSLKTPQGRAMIERIAKTQGFKTPEEYITYLEENLENLGLN